MKKILKHTILLLIVFAFSVVNAQDKPKVVVVPLFGDESSSPAIEYSGVAPIVVDNANRSISFQAPAPVSKSNMQPSLVLNYSIALQGIFPSRSFSEPLIGTISTFGFNFAPRGWALCQGQLLPINQNQALFSVLGTTYGGDGRTSFALPDLRGRTAIGYGHGPGLSNRVWGQKLGSETTVR